MRILLPLDGPINPHLRQFFAQMPNASSATVAVLHVLARSPADEPAAALVARAFLDDAARALRSAGVTAVECIRHGDAVEEIITLGRQLDADLIVMYARAAGRFARPKPGDVTERVLNAADRPAIAVNDHARWDTTGAFGSLRLSLAAPLRAA